MPNSDSPKGKAAVKASEMTFPSLLSSMRSIKQRLEERSMLEKSLTNGDLKE